MKLPNHEQALVPKQKIAGYLLSVTHEDGQHKARFFLSFGFDPEQWESLAEALRLHAAENEVAKTEASPFGTRYVIEGPLAAPDGRKPHVRAVWFMDTGDQTPRFVTAYPLKGTSQ